MPALSKEHVLSLCWHSCCNNRDENAIFALIIRLQRCQNWTTLSFTVGRALKKKKKHVKNPVSNAVDCVTCMACLIRSCCDPTRSWNVREDVPSQRYRCVFWDLLYASVIVFHFRPTVNYTICRYVSPCRWVTTPCFVCYHPKVSSHMIHDDKSCHVTVLQCRQCILFVVFTCSWLILRSTCKKPAAFCSYIVFLLWNRGTSLINRSCLGTLKIAITANSTTVNSR